MELRQTNHKTKDQEAVKKPWFLYVYQPGGIKLIGVLRPDCSCSRQSYNIESRGLGSFAVSWDESGKSIPTSWWRLFNCINTALYRWSGVKLFKTRLLQLGMGYGLRLTSGNDSTIAEIISKSTESKTIKVTQVQTAVSGRSYDQGSIWDTTKP